jgi:small subunit ribosomal protein S16
MVTIRLSRSGAKKKPFYHFTVTDSRRPRDSGYIERLGFFNPFAKGQEIRLKIDHERLEYWLSVGAQTSDKVTNLVKESKMTPDQLSKLQEKKELIKTKRIAKKSEQHKIDSPSDESSDEGSEVEVADGENSNKQEINMEKDKNIVEEGIEGVGETAKEAIEGAAEVAGEGVEAVVETAGAVAEGAVDTAKEVVEAVGETVEAAVDGVAEVGSEVAEAAGEIADAVMDGDVKGAVKEVAEGVTEVAGAAVDAVTDTASEVVEGAAEIVGEAAETVVDTAKEVVEGASEVVEEAVEAVSETVEAAVEGVSNVVDSIKDSITGEDDDK